MKHSTAEDSTKKVSHSEELIGAAILTVRLLLCVRV